MRLLAPSEGMRARPLSRRGVLAAAGGLALAGVPGVAGVARAASGWSPREAEYDIAVRRKDAEITMSDGVVLVADVLRPAGPDGRPASGRFPVVLTQTPYNKNLPEFNFRADTLVRRGYVQVIADVRGTGGSGGRWSAFGTREQRDGLELAAWCG
ncbi:MAG: CocE/NonD family hydrolase [Streptosporangiaceae bacterium]